MKLTNKITKIFRNPEKIAEEIAISYKEKKENKEENPIDDTVEEIMQTIGKNYDSQKTREILTEIVTKLPPRVFEKTARKISESEKIPDSIITEVVNESNIPDTTINVILKETKMKPKERMDLIHNIGDANIIEQQIINELNILYNVCKNKKDIEVTERVNELKALLKGEETSEEIQDLICKIVSKKMAENYYSDISKGTHIYTLSKIMPVEDMIEKDLASIVEKEYQEIEEKEGKKEGRFDKTSLKNQILIELGKDIAYKYRKTKTFIIPQLENIKGIDKKEEEMFIKAIQTYSKKQLTKQEVKEIDEQIRGNSSNIQIKEKILIGAIQKIPEKENKGQTIDLMNRIVTNKDTLKTVSILYEKGLIEKLNNIPEEKREDVIESIADVLNKRNKKIDESSPKIEEER